MPLIFNGFGGGRDTSARLYGRTGRDRYRVLGHDATATPRGSKPPGSETPT